MVLLALQLYKGIPRQWSLYDLVVARLNEDNPTRIELPNGFVSRQDLKDLSRIFDQSHWYRVRMAYRDLPSNNSSTTVWSTISLPRLCKSSEGRLLITGTLMSSIKDAFWATVGSTAFGALQNVFHAGPARYSLSFRSNGFQKASIALRVSSFVFRSVWGSREAIVRPRVIARSEEVSSDGS